MEIEQIIDHLKTWLPIVAAIFFGWKSHRLNLKVKQYREQIDEGKKTEELGIVEAQLNRIASIEHASKVGSYRYSALINEGVLTTEIVNNIYSKCIKHGIRGDALVHFKTQANSALANNTWNDMVALTLVRSAKALEDIVKKELP